MSTTNPKSGPGLSPSARMAIVLATASGLPIGAVIVWATWWNAWSWVGAALMSFSPMLAARLAAKLFQGAAMRPAMRRYSNRLALNMVVYFGVLMGATLLYDRGLASGPLGWVAAIAPAVPILGIFAIMGRFLREETDEVMRSITMISLVWSGALTFCEATVWGFLETFGKVPHVWMWVVPVAFFAQIAITGPLAHRKYR